MGTNLSLELFIAGLTLSFSFCTISCAPPLLIYLAGTTKGWKEGVKNILIFSLFRLLSYFLLGFLSGLLGIFVIHALQDEILLRHILMGIGVFISLTGIFMIFGRESSLPLCRILFQGTVKNKILTMALLGLFMNISFPCAPLLSILTYIAFTVENPWMGGFYGFCFGLGSALITPLFFLGALASTLPTFFFRNQIILEIFKKACGFLLFIFGLRFILNS